MPKIIDKNHLGQMDFYYITYQREKSGWGFENHTHRDICDLTYLKSGRLNQIINGRKVSFTTGDLIFIRAADTHALSSRDLEMFNINFHQNELTKIASIIYKQADCEKLISQSMPPHTNIPQSERKNFESRLHQLLTGLHSQSGSTQFHRFLFNTFADYIAPITAADSAESLPVWLADCIKFIDRNLQQDLSPATLVRKFSRSREHIARSFRKHLKMTLSQYISRRRLELACTLLTNTNRDILDICFSLGFNSPSYFYRQFKQRYGLPPLAYRKEKSPLYSGRIF